jgi:putative tryptophan/tyrosine transport system substrate-binding protein
VKRREFIALLGGCAAAPFAARAQPADRRRLVGMVGAFTDADMRPLAAAFRDRMRQRGWIEGRNITFDVRSSGGDLTRLDADARALVDAGADTIVALGTPGLTAVNRHTKTVPVVFAMVADPVGQGLIANLSRPGGNATGLTNFEFTIGGKWLELLSQIDGKLSHVSLIINPTNTNTQQFVQAMRDAGTASGIEVNPAIISDAKDIENAILATAKKRGGGIIVFPDNLAIVHRALIIGLAEQHRIPAAYPFRIFTASGGLMSYGLDFVTIYRQAAEYVDKILRGLKPADLPVEAPNKFELVINLKTARAMGLTVPSSLLVAADEVIE